MRERGNLIDRGKVAWYRNLETGSRARRSLAPCGRSLRGLEVPVASRNAHKGLYYWKCPHSSMHTGVPPHLAAHGVMQILKSPNSWW
jgi:hypothetical protein